jgi:hypothetical protein
MKSFGKYSIPRSVQIHTDSVVPPSIERYDGAHTAPVILATDIGLEGEGPEQRLVVDTVHTTQGSYMDFVDRRIVPTCDFAATALPGMTSELCGWVGEGEGDGVVNVLALIRPDDATERGVANERHSSGVVLARRIGELAAMAMAQYLLLDKQADADMTFDTKILQKTMNKHKKRGDVAILLP